MTESTITRRDFIKGAGCAAIGVAMGLPVTGQGLPAQTAKSRVVLIRDKQAVGPDGKINGEVIQSMLDRAMTALFDKEDPSSCWKQIIRADDVVGIKSNEWGPLPTTTEVEQAIRSGVMSAGVSEKNIGIDDRGVLDDPLFKKATALINARPMRTHAWSGVGSLIKNYVMFVPEPWKYHDNSCADLGAVWHLPIVKGKTRLNVLVLLTPLFYGIGPHHFDKTYIWSYNGLLVGTDPVALDSVGLRLFQAKRQAYFGEQRPIKPVAHHIAFADKKYGLGTSDPDRIELIKLGWQKDVLI
ncbi:MAG: twin-arginine translocation signal domain-containing protein [candidate division Zixibacteria bacterium]|nr:twin-arginine translocation signal domain-containing protein [candidate division Zixibacteria bacterium]